MLFNASANVAILNREAGYQEQVRRMGDHEGQVFTSPMARFVVGVSPARSRCRKRCLIARGSANCFPACLVCYKLELVFLR